jgi:hypothetical protein
VSAQDWATIIAAGSAAVVALLGALGALYVQLRRTHQLVNSRMDELLELTRLSSRAEGRRERDEPLWNR